ncbi:uncharacterized protein SCHCODRAFT_02619890 [Schizophyllum commune H4-8]|nr:uncharacterized protein SCHCODRAFT_02619890 [Schizophyllum commune H4-8]KAI5895604.1 hypothetical protein SCHCODRAFT_02619890 [Schizophyllum commune H4-8]
MEEQLLQLIEMREEDEAASHSPDETIELNDSVRNDKAGAPVKGEGGNTSLSTSAPLSPSHTPPRVTPAPSDAPGQQLSNGRNSERADSPPTQFDGRPDDEVEQKYREEIAGNTTKPKVKRNKQVSQETATVSVTIKQEDDDGIEHEEFIEVTLTKPENGDTLWDLDALKLGPVGDIPNPLHHRFFKREVVSWAFGGSHQSTFPNAGKENDYAAYVPDWNPQLPEGPGQHGIAFGNGSVGSEKLPVFVRDKQPNAWRYCGHYSCRRHGTLDPSQMARIPRRCLAAIARDYVRKEWGRRRVAHLDAQNAADAQREGNPYEHIVLTEQSITAAFLDGRMIMSFTILEFHHFDESWFQQLLDAEKAGHRIAPEPPSAKRKSSQGPARPRKKRKAPAKKAAPAAQDSDSEVEYLGMNAPSSSQPFRRSLRSGNGSTTEPMVLEVSDEEDEDEEDEEEEDDQGF